MKDWRATILAHFVPGLNPVTAVSDSDGILREPGLLAALEAKGFAVMFFDGVLSFRLDYETRFRSRWDAGEAIELVVAFVPGEHDFATLPFDVLARARRVTLTLQDLFPRLTYDVVRQLEPSLYDALYRAQGEHAAQNLGDKLSKEFILRHLFEVDPALITKEPQLLTFLCRLHYRRLAVPEILLAHLDAVLGRRFPAWPLTALFRDRALFWAFLQERWPVFVRETNGVRNGVEEPETDSFRVAGPRRIPFGHDDVRVFIDTLFADGILSPIPWDWKQASTERWVRVGLLDPEEQNPALRLEELIDSISAALPAANASASDWQSFALRWGQLRYLWLKAEKAPRAALQGRYDNAASVQAKAFAPWMQSAYPRLYNQPAASLSMVHHTPGYLAKLLEKGEAKRVALLLVDGLALEQWNALKSVLQPQLSGVLMEESATFAWLPSITPISRQAAFSGKLPTYFPDTLQETGHDEKRWTQFWNGRGLAKHQVAFKALPGEDDTSAQVGEWITSETKALGVTLYKVDEIMHGMQLGAAGMINQVEQWAKSDAFTALLVNLLRLDFTVVVTADHGNTEAVGIGIPKQGVLCESRGERNRLFTEQTFAEACVKAAPGSRIAKHSGLPPETIPVIAPAGQAFTDKDRTIVCHGGDSLEEMAVPFVLFRNHKESHG